MINFVELNKEHAALKDDILNAVNDVLIKGDFILGGEVKAFEEDFAAYCKSKFCLGLATGTDALFYALKALGIGQGDRVVTAANTFIATTLAISYAQAQPVLVDCNEDYTIDCDKLEETLKKDKKGKIKAIIPVHLYGHPADMDRILALAKQYRLKVIEDACQAHGAFYKDRRCGSLGDIGCFSFYPAKNLGCLGDGGAVVTDNAKLAEKIAMLRNYGQKKKYYHLMKGYNSRLDTIQAAVLRIKLKYLDANNDSRRRCASHYYDLLSGSDFILPSEKEWARHVYHLFVIRHKERDRLQDFLSKEGIATGIHYPVPIHLSAAYKDLDYKKGSFPVTEKFAKEVISLPMSPRTSEEDIAFVAQALRRFR